MANLQRAIRAEEAADALEQSTPTQSTVSTYHSVPHTDVSHPTPLFSDQALPGEIVTEPRHHTVHEHELDPSPRGSGKAISFVALHESAKAGKKLAVVLKVGGRQRTIHFGAAGMDDFTKTKDAKQKARYIERHEKREDWGQSGILTPGFWARWLLWNKPTLKASMADVRKRFKL
jgi:hypothetical protein